MVDLARLASKRKNLVLRERTLRSVRRFFQERGFLEVATPLVNPSLIPEDHIHPVETEAGFLLPSPEIHMKRFLAAGYDRVFQIERYRREYAAYVDLLIRYWFNTDSVASKLREYHDLIAPYVSQGSGDKAFYGDSPMFPPEAFDDMLMELVSR